MNSYLPPSKTLLPNMGSTAYNHYLTSGKQVKVPLRVLSIWYLKPFLYRLISSLCVIWSVINQLPSLYQFFPSTHFLGQPRNPGQLYFLVQFCPEEVLSPYSPGWKSNLLAICYQAPFDLW